jgi:alkanesulfonate monooxygenase SsuD/methylene tetrahydromethanopterin reductase-like flavin-dependent oxidoreductase (luciferase family)
VTVRFAVDLAPLGPLADPRELTRLAVAAERAGWDGVSTWDVLGTVMPAPAADLFVALAAIASATERVSLITSVVVLPRRRPQLVAQAAATLDVLSGGRLILGIGAGGDPGDFTAFGEPFDGERIARLDRDAEQIDRWLLGQGEVAVGPRPVQAPRPPIWVGGAKPGALRRAARWDGWIGVATTEDHGAMALSTEDVAERVALIGAERSRLGRDGEPFDVALFAHSEPGEEAIVASYGAAGVTWWLESLSPARGSVAVLVERIEAGPPRR